MKIKNDGISNFNTIDNQCVVNQLLDFLQKGQMNGSQQLQFDATEGGQ